MYQVEPYIRKCLDSIYKQIPSDVQVILVDDGSIDESGKLCDDYASIYKQTFVFHQTNKGVASARNAGLRFAVGEYILWVDPDDWVSDDWFKTIDSVVSKHEPDIIVFDSKRLEYDKETKEVYGRKPGFIDITTFCGDIARDIRMLSGLPNKVIRRELYDDILFDESKNMLEDYDVILSLVLKAKTVYYVPSVLYYYNQRKESLVHTITPDKSFLSVKMAEKRAQSLPPEYRDAASVGIAIQAFLFCRNYYMYSSFYSAEREFNHCHGIISMNLYRLLIDREVPFRWKAKFALISSNIFKYIIMIKKVTRT